MKYPFEDKSNWDMKYPMVWRAYESRIGRVSVCLRVWHDPDTDLLKWLAWVTLTSHGHRYTAEGCCTIMGDGVNMAIYAMKQLLDALRPELLGEVVETVPLTTELEQDMEMGRLMRAAPPPAELEEETS